jgi:hypothetical protein
MGCIHMERCHLRAMSRYQIEKRASILTSIIYLLESTCFSVMKGDLILDFNRNSLAIVFKTNNLYSLARRSIWSSINGSRKIRQKDVRNSLTLWFYRCHFGISLMDRYPIHIYGQGTRLVLSLKNYDFRWSSFKWNVSRVNINYLF